MYDVLRRRKARNFRRNLGGVNKIVVYIERGRTDEISAAYRNAF
jgi:hypothetical protein